MMIRLVYVSRLKPDIDRLARNEMVAEAERRNRASGITGIIAFEGSRVCQILEGDFDAVGALFDKIATDDRHEVVNELDRTEIDRRYFGNWGMVERSMADIVTMAFSL